jgi:hypothetical protein
MLCLVFLLLELARIAAVDLVVVSLALCVSLSIVCAFFALLFASSFLASCVCFARALRLVPPARLTSSSS